MCSSGFPGFSGVGNQKFVFPSVGVALTSSLRNACTFSGSWSAIVVSAATSTGRIVFAVAGVGLGIVRVLISFLMCRACLCCLQL